MTDLTPDNFTSKYDEHGGELPHIDDRGRTSIPGLGCASPGCRAGFYSVEARTAHIKTLHPGVYSGPSEDMVGIANIRPELAPSLGVKVDDHEEGLGEHIPNDARSLEKDAPLRLSGNTNSYQNLVHGMKSHINEAHAAILQNGIDNKGIKTLAKHVDLAHTHLDNAARLGPSTERTSHISGAHEAIDNIADISENWYNESHVHEDLQDHIEKLY